MQEQKKQRVFKKYQNRKLYSTFNHCYVTLKDILEEVLDARKSGDRDVVVIDNKTKQRITDEVLVQALISTGNTHVVGEMLSAGLKAMEFVNLGPSPEQSSNLEKE